MSESGPTIDQVKSSINAATSHSDGNVATKRVEIYRNTVEERADLMGGHVASMSGLIRIGLEPVTTLTFLIQQQMVAIPQSRGAASAPR